MRCNVLNASKFANALNSSAEYATLNQSKERLTDAGRIVFAQLVNLLPLHEFHRYVHRYQGNYRVKSLVPFRFTVAISSIFCLFQRDNNVRSSRPCGNVDNCEAVIQGIVEKLKTFP
jgi:hypothetical protein